jgi:hypothetical protein
MSALNDALRFVLELVGIAALAIWGWTAGGTGPLRFLLAIAAPLALILVWAFLIAPKADSPLAPTPRMIVGSVLLLVAAAALAAAGHPGPALVFGVLVVVNTGLALVRPA